MNQPVRAVLALLVVVAVAGCGSHAKPAPRTAPSQPVRESAPSPPHRVRCPPNASAGCRSALGRVLYVEAKDPDGDGDAHFVLAGEQSITGPGIAAIDVEKALRPRRLPQIGDWVSAAGPVYLGSHGQRQIQAVKLRIRRVP